MWCGEARATTAAPAQHLHMRAPQRRPIRDSDTRWCRAHSRHTTHHRAHTRAPADASERARCCGRWIPLSLPSRRAHPQARAHEYDTDAPPPIRPTPSSAKGFLQLPVVGRCRDLPVSPLLTQQGGATHAPFAHRGIAAIGERSARLWHPEKAIAQPPPASAGARVSSPRRHGGSARPAHGAAPRRLGGAPRV